jgi:hypothetical protein
MRAEIAESKGEENKHESREEKITKNEAEESRKN